MTATLASPAGTDQGSGRGQPIPPHLPRTRSGLVKRRTTWQDKLQLLDPTAPPEQTLDRLRAFMRLFAFRVHRGIITRAGHAHTPEGHRGWIELPVPIHLEHVVRHLLGARIPTLPPQWVGARSFEASTFFCLDIDPDRPPKRHRHPKQNRRPKTPFGLRCEQVEAALRRLGIDPADPTQVLVYPSPSGGRHVYVFFDRPCKLCHYQSLLRDAGLRFTQGEIEFFPSTRHGLRFPFGHLPGHPHDPWAWIRFIDDYQAGRIKRHSLEQLDRNLTGNYPISPSAAPLSSLNRSGSTTGAPLPSRPLAQQDPLTGIPWRFRHAIDLQQTIGQRADEWFERILEEGPQSTSQAELLFTLGIRRPGTRTRILKHLTAHLIWVRGMSAEAAATALTAWAMNPRHQSKDIEEDLARGTDVVARHIERMCQCYARLDDGRFAANRDARSRRDTRPLGLLYAMAEIEALRPHVLALPPDQRPAHANFLLHFLAYAKEHGDPDPDQLGRVAAPAVNAVIKHWGGLCGCHHGHYQERISHATAAGVLTLVKPKWQNPKGKGRAATYRLAVPIVPQEYWVLDYQNALAALTIEAPSRPAEETTEPDSAQGQEKASKSALDSDEPAPAEEKENNERHPDPDAATHSAHGSAAVRGDQPPDLCAACAGVSLAPRPRERAQEPPAAPGLPGPDHGRFGAVRASTPVTSGPAHSLDEFLARERRRLAITRHTAPASPQTGSDHTPPGTAPPVRSAQPTKNPVPVG